jgi:dipeptidyl aminopeptidase/acylaminoacyl peptidase
MKTRKRALLATFLAGAGVLASQPLAAQSVADYVPPPAQGSDFPLSIRSIMRGEANVGLPPTDIRWSDDSQWLYFRWQPGGLEWDEGRSLHRVRRDGSGLTELSDEDEHTLGPILAEGDLSSDRRWRVTSYSGDLWLVDRRTMEVRRLTHTEDVEDRPLFGDDDASILFRRQDEIYRLTLASGALEQLTRIESGPEEEDDEPEGQRAFLEAQQIELFEHVRRGEARRARADSLREAREALEPSVVRLERGERVQSLVPTRSGAFVIVRASTEPEEERRTVVPDWVTEDGYTRDLGSRTKVGDVQGATRVGIVETATGAARWIDLVPEGAEDGGPARVFNAGWNDAGTVAFVFAVSSDDEDRWIWAVDAATGARTLVDHLHDDAWVAGPCFGNCMGFLPESDRLYFVSEESGWAHLYLVDADGSNRRALTAGTWEVLSVEIPEDRSRFLLRTNEGSPFDEHTVWMDFDGSNRRPLTRGEGRFVGTPSPDGRTVAIVHDVANRPPELFLADANRVGDLQPVTTSPTPEWLSFDWIRPEIVRFEAEDGTLVPARIYRPADVGAEPNGAGVIFVHGSGYLHNVHRYWSSYWREYQFHHFLAANGYTVLDIDYRGSAGYGAAWRTAIHRWMGGRDLSDQVDGARYLVDREGVDPARMGIYGGSYGGFITLMALFTAGDTFKAGAALRSVTDWAHYNHPYTSRILNLPQEDEEAFRRSSPIYFAEGLRQDQHLVMLHGMVDTNVHFSDVVRLSQRLIELGKENWELALYPVEDHAFVEPTSWADEYRRIFELFERTLREPGCTEGGGSCTVRGAAGR